MTPTEREQQIYELLRRLDRATEHLLCAVEGLTEASDLLTEIVAELRRHDIETATPANSRPI